jgi:hypothetical protein
MLVSSLTVVINSRRLAGKLDSQARRAELAVVEAKG